MNAIGELGFDPDALRSKYRDERSKRLRPDGIDQYLEVAGDDARFDDGPYVAPGHRRGTAFRFRNRTERMERHARADAR